METKNKQGLLNEYSAWATSDLVRACSKWIEEDASDWFRAWDRIPLGWLMWITQELYGVVTQRQALAGAMYVFLVHYSSGRKANKDVDYNFMRRIQNAEGEGREAECQRIREAGDKLLQVRAVLSRSEFAAWVAKELGMPSQRAAKYLAEAKRAEGRALLPNQRKRTGREMVALGLEAIAMKAKLPRGAFSLGFATAAVDRSGYSSSTRGLRTVGLASNSRGVARAAKRARARGTDDRAWPLTPRPQKEAPQRAFPPVDRGEERDLLPLRTAVHACGQGGRPAGAIGGMTIYRDRKKSPRQLPFRRALRLAGQSVSWALLVLS